MFYLVWMQVHLRCQGWQSQLSKYTGAPHTTLLFSFENIFCVFTVHSWQHQGGGVRACSGTTRRSWTIWQVQICKDVQAVTTHTPPGPVVAVVVAVLGGWVQALVEAPAGPRQVVAC